MGYINKLLHRNQNVDKAEKHEKEKSAEKQKEDWENICDGVVAVCVMCGCTTIMGSQRSWENEAVIM